MAPRIVLLDAERSRSQGLRRRLARHGLQVTVAASVRKALEEQERDSSVVLVVRAQDASFWSGARILCSQGKAPVIGLGEATVASSLQALDAGVADYVADPHDVTDVLDAIWRVVAQRELLEKLHDISRVRGCPGTGEPSESSAVLGEDSTGGYAVGVSPPGAVGVSPLEQSLLGSSPAMRELRSKVVRLAASPVTVLISGETGTGKELVARSLHQESPRASGPFVALNCAAMPSQLVESELFGHIRGAFTGAHQAHQGLLLHSSGGTLFLDELGSMPLSTQAKLLRVLQEKAVRPLGAAKEVPFDARLIAATNVDLAEGVASGKFREDLFFRLNVVALALPPLRERGDDVLLLTQHFIRHFSARMNKNVVTMTPGAARTLMRYHWPGNVRELANCIRTALVNARYDHLTQWDLPISSGEDGLAPGLSALDTLSSVAERHIVDVMRSVGGNKSRAARLLGLSRKTLTKKLSRVTSL